MGFYLRKSFRVGKFGRLNLSRGGLGFSLGVPGARLGVDARGRAYIHAGSHGIYYKEYLSPGRSSSSVRRPVPVTPAPPPQNVTNSDPPLTEIATGDVGEMVDASSEALLAELNRVECRVQVFPVLLVCLIAVVIYLAYCKVVWWAYLLLAFPAIPALIFSRHLDVTNGTVYLKYEMDNVAEVAYSRFKAAFNAFNCNRVWSLEAMGGTSDWKRNAGATGLVRRKRIYPSLSCPSRVVSNIDVPMVASGAETFYFFPDRILVYQRGKVGTVTYENITGIATQTRFVESEGVPHDAQVVATTWRYVNKDGGPDRRFKANHQIPVTLYGELRLTSNSGINKAFQTSRADAAIVLRNGLVQFLGRGEMSGGIVVVTLLRPDKVSVDETNLLSEPSAPPTQSPSGLKVYRARDY